MSTVARLRLALGHSRPEPKRVHLLQEESKA